MPPVKAKNIINIFSRPVSVPGNGVLCLYKNGEIEKWSEIHYIPIKDSTGTVSAVEGILRDITERKKMEEQVKLNENENKDPYNSYQRLYGKYAGQIDTKRVH